MIEFMNNVHYFMQSNQDLIKIIFIVIGAIACGFVINMDKKLKIISYKLVMYKEQVYNRL